MKTAHKTFCRFCSLNCAITVDVEDGVALSVRGDPEDPIYGGYTCVKGRELANAHYDPKRLRSSVRRGPGGFEQIGTETALDEVAEKLREIVARHGARSIAMYTGTASYMDATSSKTSRAFLKALGSPNMYTTATIDQPAKAFWSIRMGWWAGGQHSFADADVLMVLGNNPLVSHYSPSAGINPFNASRRLRDARANGLKLIVIDPRRTEVAQLADIHLQVRPNEDATLLAGITRIIIEEGLYDKAFTTAHADNFARLRAAVADFDLDYVAHRTGVSAALIEEAARAFAAGPRGAVSTGTGTEMSKSGRLVEYLVNALNIICGRFYREGEVSRIPRITSPDWPRTAEVIPPAITWGGDLERSRIRGFSQLAGPPDLGTQMPLNALADEILTPGEGQVRALICVGGNPAVAVPNQDKLARALDSLDLLVTVDIKVSQTGSYADYIFSTPMPFEHSDIMYVPEWNLEVPYNRYTDALFPPPGDLQEPWELFWGLSQRMGVTMDLPGGPLPIDRRPEKDDILRSMCAGSRVPFDRLKADTAGTVGKIYEAVDYIVGPGNPENTARFELAPDDLPDWLMAVRREQLDEQGRPAALRGFSHLLICRRVKHVFNSIGTDMERLLKNGASNYAFLHPDDMAAIGVANDDVIEITSSHSSIYGIVRSAPDLLPGTLSMAHSWGAPGAGLGELRKIGSTTNKLVNEEVDYDPITGMAPQTGIPINIRAVSSAEAARAGEREFT